VADPIRLPDGRTLGEVAYSVLFPSESGYGPSADPEAWESIAQAVLAADPARAQAVAALKQALNELPGCPGEDGVGYMWDNWRCASAIQDALAALKGGGR
jgi:hypothetical protein